MLQSIKQEDGAPNLYINPVSKLRRKKIYVTIEQKEFFIHFAKENPELVAHKPNFKLRAQLWKKLVSGLNNLKPEKTSKFWNNYWHKWLSKLHNKQAHSWTALDQQLNKFLTDVGYFENRSRKQVHLNIKLPDEEINDQLKKIEKDKVKLNIENDVLNFEKYILQNRYKELHLKIKEMDRKCKENRKKLEDIIERKHYLNHVLVSRKS